MNVINDSVNRVNEAIEASLGLGDRARYLCLADLVEKDGRIQPVIKRNLNGERALPNANYLLNIYHRLIDTPEIEQVDGMGDDIYENVVIRIRLFGFAKTDIFGADTYTSHHIALRVMDAMGTRIPIFGEGIRRLAATKRGPVIIDSDVWRSEYPSVDEGKANPMRLAAFTFDYMIQGQLCAGYCVT